MPKKDAINNKEDKGDYKGNMYFPKTLEHYFRVYYPKYYRIYYMKPLH
jgi:hypothetical protein